jgi:transposase InsO family protein
MAMRIERLYLTVRQAVAAQCRRTWGLAQSPDELHLHLEWWRAYYHFVRPHTSLSARHPDGSRPGKRGRLRTPAQAAELTDHTWTVLELLSFPLPKTAR